MAANLVKGREDGKSRPRLRRKESIEEMQHADQLVARILFVDGLANMESLDRRTRGRRLASAAAELNVNKR